MTAEKWNKPATLREHVELSTSGGRVWVEPVVTPEYAAELLSHLYPGQRNVRPQHVARIARAMRAGRFAWTGDPVRVWLQTGQLFDGQHRLSACVETGISMRDVLFVGITDEQAMQYIDASSAPRSAADVRKVRGVKNVSNATAGGIVLEFSDFRPSDAAGWNKPERVEIEQSCEFLDDLEELSALGKRRGVTSGVLAGALRCMRMNKDAAMKFFRAVLSQVFVIDGTYCQQAWLLSTYLMTRRHQRSSLSGRAAVQPNPLEDAYKSVQAYNAWRRGQEISRLQCSGQPTPKAAS